MKIVKSDLSGGYVTSLLAMLDKEGTESDGIIDSISQLIDDIDAGNLSGPGYDSVKARLGDYVLLFKERKQKASELEGAIVSALGMMKDYMAEDDYLDDSELENLKSSLRSIEILHQQVLSNEELTQEMKIMAWGYQDEMDKIRKKIAKLEKLQPTDSSAFGNIAAAQGNMGDYQTKVNNMAINGVNITIC